jgi:hypothetical protein
MEGGLVELLYDLEAKTSNLGQACEFFHADSSDVSAAINSTFLKLYRLREIITEIQQIRKKRDENNEKVRGARDTTLFIHALNRSPTLDNSRFNFCPSFTPNGPQTTPRFATAFPKGSRKNSCEIRGLYDTFLTVMTVPISFRAMDERLAVLSEAETKKPTKLIKNAGVEKVTLILLIILPPAKDLIDYLLTRIQRRGRYRKSSTSLWINLRPYQNT